MIKNYFKSASRNILKRKLYSFINAFGLSIGIAFCLLIYLFIQDEKSFDQFHKNKKDIHLISNRSFDFNAFKKGEKEPYTERVGQYAGLGEVMVEELQEVRNMTRYFSYAGPGTGLLRYQQKVFRERLTCVDSGFFKMFSFKLLEGNPDKLFQNKSDIVLTQKAAEKYFDKENPVGKLMVLDMNGERAVTVAGVIENPPANSSISFDILMPLANSPSFQSGWSSQNYPTFVQLQPGTDLASFKTKLNKLHQDYTGDASREFREREKIPEELPMDELHLVGLTDIHLDTGIKWEKSSDPKYSFILGGISILILIMACINYVSLALTSSSTRNTEVGIRKVSGAHKRQLIFQFGTESIVLASVSMIIGLLLVFVFLPSFNSFTNKGIVPSFADWLQFIIITLLLTGAVGIIAGSYPALYLSGLNPVHILKGRSTSRVNTGLVKPLMVTQFAISAFLILSAMVMHQQMKFITTKDLGYDQRHILSIATQGWDDETDRLVENFRLAVADDPSVKSVAGTSIAFTNGTMTLGFPHEGKPKVASGYIVDPNYLSTLGIELKQGRNFDVRNPTDGNEAVIVNETLVKEMKWTEPLHEHLNWRWDQEGLGSRVIGVVEDHHFLSLERSIDPMFLTMDKTRGHFQYILVKISPLDIPGTIYRLEKVYKALAPDKPFEYTFLDESVSLQYQPYNRWMSIMSITTGFAILISCLGLFGLAGMNVVNRTKEIGIRKVLGAGLSSVFVLLNRQFIWLSVIAFALAAFPAWYAMNKWLDSFQFKIQVSWVHVAMSMGVGLFVALVAVSYHTLKAIRLNAADTIKYE